MKVVFVSNFMNHHQLPLCNYFFETTDDFKFICVGAIPENTLKFGYSDLSRLPYVIKKSADNIEIVNSAIMNSDVAIFGDCPTEMIYQRVSANKLSFIFSERMWKKGVYRRFIPFIRKKVVDRFTKFKNKDLYVLCASCYLPWDIRLVGFPVDKCYQWGYFTPFEELDIEKTLSEKIPVTTILWVARFIPLKRCIDLLKAVKRLKKDGYKFSVRIIGSGQLEEQYRKQIIKYHISECINIIGNMTTENVRAEMKKAHILAFTSNYIEGWGAVVNEAMNSLCVPVVSHAVGSSRYLIKNGNNGLIYKMGSNKDLYIKLKSLLDDQNLLMQMQINAYETIKNEYRGEIAGERFLNITKAKLDKEDEEIYKEGPMSRATIIKNNWIKAYGKKIKRNSSRL